jgi:hypothetical protein
MTLPPVASAMRQIEGKDFKKQTPRDRYYYFETSFLFMESYYLRIVNRCRHSAHKLRNARKIRFTPSSDCGLFRNDVALKQ